MEIVKLFVNYIYLFRTYLVSSTEKSHLEWSIRKGKVSIESIDSIIGPVESRGRVRSTELQSIIKWPRPRG